MTYYELLHESTEYLKTAGINEYEAANSAWILMSETLGISRSDYIFRIHDDCDGDDADQKQRLKDFRKLLEKRHERIPLQQILGSWSFMGYEFKVNEHVLSPRPETELLVTKADKMVSEGASVLDMCTGSGCIILSLMRHKLDMGERIIGVGADLSEDALEVARENEQSFRLQLEAEDDFDISWVLSDMFENVRGLYDCIVSNPPYIRPDVIETLEPEVKDHEPRMALDGGGDGLDFYRKLAEKAPAHLKKGGWLLMEIGYDQGADVSDLLRQHGFCDISVTKDYAELDRIVCGRFAG